MIANLNDPKVNPRLIRIKNFSRILKRLCLAYFVLVGLDFFHRGINQSTGSKIYQLLTSSILLLTFIVCYRLLNLFEKAVIFSPENTSQIRRLGFLAIAYALLNACSPIFLPNEGIFSSLSILCYFVNFSLSPFLFAGGFVVILSWIMDEGRKIQEEQELTV